MATPLPDPNSSPSFNRSKPFRILLSSSSSSFFFFFFLLLLHTASADEQSPSSQIPYSPRCNHIVPESTPSDPYKPPFTFLRVWNAYVANAQQILGPPSSHVVADFRARSVFHTQKSEILKIDGVLHLRVSRIWGFSRNSTGRRLLRVYGGPRFSRIGGNVLFSLSGFWSSSSGMLCMVGSSRVRSPGAGKNLIHNVVFKLSYPSSSNISNSLVTGRLESLNSEGSDGYFKPISVLDVSKMNYEYTLIREEISDGSALNSNVSSSGLDTNRLCSDLVLLTDRFELEYGGSCGSSNCTLLDQVFGFLPKFMSMNSIDCSGDQFGRFYFAFSNSSTIGNGFMLPFDPNNTLIAEGAWTEDKNRLRLLACSVLIDSSGYASVGDCSVRLNLTFASELSLRSRSLVSGQMWSSKNATEVGYFDRVGIRTSGPRRLALPGMEYEYTETERANRYCSSEKAAVIKGTHYPDPYSVDMKFDMQVKNNKKQKAWGSAIPIYVNDRMVLDGYGRSRFPTVKHLGVLSHGAIANHTRGILVNVSYVLTFDPLSEFQLGGKTFSNQAIYTPAEGIYDSATGLLCMVGCRTHEADGVPLHNLSAGADCEIFIRIQFAHKASGMAKGFIKSKRLKSDPLYFDQLDLSGTSITTRQAKKSIWRMDLEITMVLISNALACIFLVLQLLHVRSHPDVLPFVSVVMLVILTLGHMTPLLLNFDAFLSNRKSKSVLLGTSDWLEINEVVVRVTTMIAFLLEARLLQLSWTSRGSSENRKILWSTEKKVVYLSLPLCLFGALIAWLLHPWSSPHKTSLFRSRYQTAHWRELKAYAGLILDAFLFPQIIFNVLCDSKEKALAPAYYFGTTVVRLLPHAYDLSRSHSSALKVDLWFIYANPRMNFYSTAWDIIISCCGLLFAIVIYLQQRFGGRWVLPSNLPLRYKYEKVPVATSDNN